MVVYAIEARRCSECPKVLPLECFPTGNRKKDGTWGRRSRCPDCHRSQMATMPSRTSERVKRQKAERYRRLRATPEGRAHLRRQNRESRQRRMFLSEEAREGARRAARDYQRRRREDPVWREAENARLRDRRAYLREHDPDAWLRLCERDRRNHNKRMRSAKARMKKNEAARLAKASRTAERLGPDYEYRPQGKVTFVDVEDGLLLDIEPFLEYVEERIELERRALHVAGEVFDRETAMALGTELASDGLLTPEGRFCARVLDSDGKPLDPRTLYRWRHEAKRVQLDLVDRVLTRFEEPFMLDVLYPDIDELLAA